MNANTIQIISIIVSGIIGICGLIVAGLSAYWAYAGRIEPFKKQLYDRQTEGATECINALVDLQFAIETHHASIGNPEYLSEENKESFILETKEAKDKLKLCLYKWSPLLAIEVFLPITHYISIVEFASDERDSIQLSAGVGYPSANPWLYLPGYFLEAVAAVRDFLGIEPLGKELSETFGLQTVDKKERDEKERIEIISQKTQVLGYLMSKDYRRYDGYKRGYIPPYERHK